MYYCTFIGCHLSRFYQSQRAVPRTKTLTTKHLNAIFTSFWLIVKSALAVELEPCTDKDSPRLLSWDHSDEIHGLWLTAWRRRCPMSEPASSWGVPAQAVLGMSCFPCETQDVVQELCFFSTRCLALSCVIALCNVYNSLVDEWEVSEVTIS